MRFLRLLLCIAAGGALAYSQSYSPLYAPSSNQTLYAYCYYNGYIIQNCTVAVGATYYADTNAHFHDVSRPSSTISPSSGNTGSAGYFPVTLTTTAVGQAESAYACAYSCTWTDYAVGYGDIYYTSNAIFTLVGGNTTNHGDNSYNHWMMSDAAYDIYYTCNDYITAHSLSTCSLNDMALPFGGVFDINDNWTTPHVSHDRGRAVDINGIPSGNVAEFLQDCRNHSAVDARQELNGSLHCRF